MGPRTCFKDLDVEAMTDAVRCGRYTCQSRTYDSNPRSPKLHTRPRGFRSEELANDPLDKLVDKGKGMEDDIFHDSIDLDVFILIK